MTAHNPYAPSKASLQGGQAANAGSGMWHDDNELVVAHGATFPDRCVKCNEPAESPHKVRKVYWHHPAVYLLLFGYVFLYVIVALVVRRMAEIDPGLCAEHRRKRNLWIGAGWGGVLVGWVLVFAMGSMVDADPGAIALLVLLVFLASAGLGVVNSRILYAKRIDVRHARLKGADPRFLASLPPYVEGSAGPEIKAFPNA